MPYTLEPFTQPREEEISNNEESDSSPEPELEGHQEYREPDLPVQYPTNVVQAIHAAAPDRIYTLLLEIVTNVPAAKALAEERLLARITCPAVSSVRPDLKRKAYEICETCDEEYSVESNTKGGCVYHDGEKEEDDSDDFWADHPDGMGYPEDLVDEPDFQDGFRWNCCNKKAPEAGCIVSKHVPKEDVVTKKARPVLGSVSANANGAASFRGPGGRAVIDLA